MASMTGRPNILGTMLMGRGGDIWGTMKGEQQMRTQAQANRIAREQWAMQKKQYKEQRAERMGTARAGARGLSRLIGSYNRAYGQARTANERRYQEMLGLTERTTGQRAADIRAEGVGEEANIMQQLARTGMAGTTVAPTMREGARRWTSEKLNRLADTMQGTRLGIMERRTDAYPESGMITSLASLLGQGGGGGAGMYKALSRMRLS